MAINMIVIEFKDERETIQYLTFDDEPTEALEKVCEDNNLDMPEWNELQCDWKQREDYTLDISYFDGDSYV